MRWQQPTGLRNNSVEAGTGTSSMKCPDFSAPRRALLAGGIRPHTALSGLVLVFALVGPANADSNGTAVVRAAGTEYVIPIVCREAALANAGFSTEPSRVTRAATGRTSPARLTVRRWKDTDELVISLDRYIAWIAAPDPTGSRFAMTLDMSPSSFLRDGLPVTMTYDVWSAGDRPAGLQDVVIDADCSERDPEAPGSRPIPPAEN